GRCGSDRQIVDQVIRDIHITAPRNYCPVGNLTWRIRGDAHGKSNGRITRAGSEDVGARAGECFENATPTGAGHIHSGQSCGKSIRDSYGSRSWTVTHVAYDNRVYPV